jgi:DNA-directed RNA polymerase specialized sigma24 family protein
LAALADIGRAWRLAALALPERQAALCCHGFGMTARAAGVVLGSPKSTVQARADRAVGKLTDWLNGTDLAEAVAA